MIRSFRPEHVPQPKSEAPFGPFAEGSVDLEIGCGVGLHPIRYAQANPQRRLIAIERTQTRFNQLQRRLADHPAIDNVAAIRADAIRWITHRVPRGALSRVFILYPNPYPKARQHNQRWHRMPFMACLRDAMAPGAMLTLATNRADYAQDARRVMVEYWGFALESDRRIPADAPPRTHFERKYLARGEACFDLVFRRPTAGKSTTD